MAVFLDDYQFDNPLHMKMQEQGHDIMLQYFRQVSILLSIGA